MCQGRIDVRHNAPYSGALVGEAHLPVLEHHLWRLRVRNHVG